MIPWVRVTVLVDNEPNEGLINEWGLSMWVETHAWQCLFDADTSPSVLEHNLNKLKISPSKLDFAVLSHHHYDHSGGFSYIGRVSPNLTTYMPPGPQDEFISWGLKPCIVKGTKQIAESAYVIGPLKAWAGFYEIALAVDVEKIGLIILVGCSHPGVDRIAVTAAEELGRRVHAVIGGFHNPSRDTLDRLVESVEKVFPAHCTGDSGKKYLFKKYPGKYGKVKTGTVIEFGTVLNKS